MEAALPRLNSKVLPALAFLLLLGGALLLAWVGVSISNPGPATYHYDRVQEGAAGLDTGTWPDLEISRYEVRVGGVDQPVAVTHVARRGDGSRVMLDWENRSSEPLLSVDVQFAELTALAQAIEKHTAKDALVLAWWDTSQQLRLLTGRATAFDAHVGEPFIGPASWRARSGPIGRYEGAFWGAPASAAERRELRRFADALTSPDIAAGAAKLRALAGGRDAYVAVHVSDLYKLGLMYPDRLGVAYKDFPVQGDLHGPVGFVQHWMRVHDYSAYALHDLGEDRARAYFLADAKSCNTLLAQMLPLTTSRPLDLQALQLVYQHGGYWVYRIPPAPRSGG